jgi:hypothetical protein
VPAERIWIIPPSLDPFSAKNAWLSGDDVHAVQRHAGLVDVESSGGGLSFTRRDGTAGVVRAQSGLLRDDATVVVRESLVEGFGLTLTEPMWKGRPVVASVVGGIQDQIVDGVSSVLLDDPTDLACFARVTSGLLREPARQNRIGVAAQERVRDCHLGDRHLNQYAELLEALMNRGNAPGRLPGPHDRC